MNMNSQGTVFGLFSVSMRHSLRVLSDGLDGLRSDDPFQINDGAATR